MAWAEDWIATCFELQTGRPPAPGEREAIHRAMALLRDPGQRTHPHALRGAGAGRDDPIGAALLHAGRHARPAARCRDDGLTDSHFLVFEIEDLMAMGERNLIPVLLYLFRRFEQLSARASRPICCSTRPGSCSGIRCSARRSANG